MPRKGFTNEQIAFALRQEENGATVDEVYAWTRDGLDRRTRSMINLAMLTALSKPAELKLNVKGALANGVSVEEIKAILLHATVYCGIPTGLDPFKAAHEVLKAEGAVFGKPVGPS